MKKNIKIGSKITFLDSIDSTNNYAANLINEKNIMNGQVIMADIQGEGRGQRGTQWLSEGGKNILASIYLELDNLAVKNQTLLLKFTAVSIFDALEAIGLTPKIKWPNDILIDGKKICGVLIENQFIGQKIKSSIIGLGLNVNQEKFDLDQVTSIKLELKIEQERMSILGLLLNAFNKNLDILFTNPNYFEQSYLCNLYKYKEMANFYCESLGGFSGKIEGIAPDGKIIISHQNKLLHFDLKEVKFC
jgi:BirA family biotin operon repressor/biotin-[acetyl-CoA-carboxylase] ligase